MFWRGFLLFGQFAIGYSSHLLAGGIWGRSWRISFSAPSEAFLIKGRFGGIVYTVADSSAKRTKKAIIFRLSLCVERKTRLEPTLRAGSSRELYLHPPPTPERGDFGVARSSLMINKKQSHFCNCLIFRAENETRTRDPNLGKVVLYQLSYFRKMFNLNNQYLLIASAKVYKKN